MLIVQKRVSHSPSPDGKAWIDMNPPGEWLGSFASLMSWLRVNIADHGNGPFRIIDKNDIAQFHVTREDLSI